MTTDPRAEKRYPKSGKKHRPERTKQPRGKPFAVGNTAAVGRREGDDKVIRTKAFTNRMMELFERGMAEDGGSEKAILKSLNWLFKRHPHLYIGMLQALVPNKAVNIDASVNNMQSNTVKISSLSELRDTLRESGLPVPEAFPIIDYTKRDAGSDVVEATAIDDPET